MDTITIPTELLEQTIDLLVNPKNCSAQTSGCILDRGRRDRVLEALLAARQEDRRNKGCGRRNLPVLTPPETGLGWQPEGIPLDKLWVISDTHFFHKNIAAYCGRPDGWQEMAIENWLKLVGPEDAVLHLGDVALGPKQLFDDLSGHLPGRMFLVRGNHDQSAAYYQKKSWQVLEEPLWIMRDGEWIVCSHRPLWTARRVINLHGHVHNTPGWYDHDPQHINVSLDVRDLRPWRLGELLAEHQARWK